MKISKKIILVSLASVFSLSYSMAGAPQGDAGGNPPPMVNTNNGNGNGGGEQFNNQNGAPQGDKKDGQKEGIGAAAPQGLGAGDKAATDQSQAPKAEKKKKKSHKKKHRKAKKKKAKKAKKKAKKAD